MFLSLRCNVFVLVLFNRVESDLIVIFFFLCQSQFEGVMVHMTVEIKYLYNFIIITSLYSKKQLYIMHINIIMLLDVY